MMAAVLDNDWSWLRRAVARLQHEVAPSGRKAGRARSSTQLLALGLRLMAEAEAADLVTPSLPRCRLRHIPISARSAFASSAKRMNSA
jgi:hypothetical protein